MGDGFRRHLSRCREASDPWAVDMYDQIQRVSSSIKEIQLLVQNMRPTPNKLHVICKEVMSSAHPPVRLNAGSSTCAITGKTCTMSLDLMKSNKSPTSVDSRFCIFFMFLWYCNKIEYIVRSYTRTWCDLYSDNETSTEQQCLKFSTDMKDNIKQMYELFLVAYSHVTNTLNHYSKTILPLKVEV